MTPPMSDTVTDTSEVVDSVSAFRDAFRESAVASGHMEAAETAPERSRGDDGRFVAQEAAEAEAPADEPVEASEEETPEEETEEDPSGTVPDFIDPKYRSAPDPIEAQARAYAEAQKKLGETSRDAKAYKELEEEVRALREQMGKPATPQYDPSQLESWFAENPHLVPQAAVEAKQRGDTQLYDAAMEAWYQMSPRQAAAYERQIEVADLKAELDAKLGQSMQPLVQQQQAAEYQIAVNNVAEQIPEIKDEAFAEQMMANLQARPYMLETLRSGTLEAKELLLADLARITLEGRAPVLAKAQQEQAKIAKAEAAKAKQEAQVLTTGTAAPPEKTGTTAFKEAFRNSPEFRKAAGDLWQEAS